MADESMRTLLYEYISSSHTFTFQLLDKPWSQVSSLLPPGSRLQFLSRIRFSNPPARRFFFHRVSLTHALALSASQFMHEKKSQRIYTGMHSAGLELTKLTYTRLEDNLIRHRGDRLSYATPQYARPTCHTQPANTSSFDDILEILRTGIPRYTW